MSDQNHRLCTVCDQPMLPGQAFNGLKGSHWNCAPTVRFERPEPFFRVIDKAPAPVSEKVVSDHNRPAPRLPEKGPTSKDIRLAAQNPEARQIESRRGYEMWRRPVNGKTSIGLECPFCYTIVQAFVWSLPNGKRCPCGAFHGRLLSTHWREPNN